MIKLCVENYNKLLYLDIEMKTNALVRKSIDIKANPEVGNMLYISRPTNVICRAVGINLKNYDKSTN